MALSEFGVHLQHIVKEKDFSMWAILLPTPEDCITLIKKGPTKTSVIVGKLEPISSSMEKLQKLYQNGGMVFQH